MSAIRVLLQSARLPIFRSGSASAADVKAWIASGNYFFDHDVCSNSFSLCASDPDQLRQALANDMNRLAAASFESAAGVGADPSLPKSLAWGVIRSYYAAFFAAHGLMRLFGTACVQLEDAHASRVFAAAQVFGRTGGLAGINSGFYSADIDPGFERVTFTGLRESHRDTWATLLAVIDRVDKAIPGSSALSADKIEASRLLSDIRSGITRSGAVKGNWLSNLRNSINYRQTHGAWYPYNKRANPALLESAGRAWRVSPSAGSLAATGSDLDVFFGCASAVVSLLRELVTVAAELSSPPSPTFARGCLKLLNESQTPRARV
jgi:hypothetical protein